MTAEIVNSLTIQALDSLNQGTFAPIKMPTAGEGAPGILRRVTDVVTPTALGMATAGSSNTDGSFYRLCRFPTGARLKALRVDLGVLDTGGATAVFDINVAFSDSLNDGTQSQYTTAGSSLTTRTALCIPKTGQAGTVTSPHAYSTPNKLFGTITVGNNAVKLNTDQTFLGTYGASGTVGTGANVNWSFDGPEYPLWWFFGFKDTQGNPCDPGGMFDLLFYLSTAANTGASAEIRAALDFIY